MAYDPHPYKKLETINDYIEPDVKIVGGTGITVTDSLSPFSFTQDNGVTFSGNYHVVTISNTAPAAQLNLVDDFCSGNTSNGSIGQLGWTANTATLSIQAAEQNHAGILRVATGATASTTASLYGRSTSNVGSVHSGDNFDFTFIVRLNTNDTDTRIAFGLGDNGASATPSGFYIQKLAADTNWWFVSRSGASQTRADSSVAISTNFVKFRCRRVDASTINFSINDGTETSITTNLYSGSVTHFLNLTNSTAVDKNADIDLMWLKVNQTR